ncbi:MAG: sugar ABC transporter permease, partial [Anaerolineales bacterium]|nr:sugar ABC transporter permease [Anaerolineales bacterium]
MRAGSASQVSFQGRPKWVKEWFSKETLVAWLFILPSLIGFITFYAVPAVRGLFFSFTDWDMLSDPKFIWFDNYKDIFADKEFWRSLRVTAYYVL